MRWQMYEKTSPGYHKFTQDGVKPLHVVVDENGIFETDEDGAALYPLYAFAKCLDKQSNKRSRV
jgi:hypothetical protein